MCRDCGCGLPAEEPVGISARHDEHEHGHRHDHEHGHHPGHHHGEPHAHTHPHSHTHEHAGHSHEGDFEERTKRTLEVRESILVNNDRLAERNRGFFRARGLLVLNVVSSPGSGKTLLLQATLRALAPRLKAGVIVGDLATDNDAQRLRESGAPVVQITTGTVCHLDAAMVARAVHRLDLAGLQLLIVENVGNLVCPASFDLGEDIRVVLWSVTEGEDKPLKYPPIFQAANVVVISKTDLIPACGCDRELALANVRRVAPAARIFETSARTGQGLEAWCDYLVETQQAMARRSPLES